MLAALLLAALLLAAAVCLRRAGGVPAGMIAWRAFEFCVGARQTEGGRFKVKKHSSLIRQPHSLV